MIAFSVGCVGSFDYLAAYGVPLYPFGYLPVFAFLVMTARAIWSYRLADITSAFAVKEIINAMTDALFVLDHDGVVRIVNQAACQLLGKTERELVGAPITTITSAISTPERLDTLMLGGSIRDYEISLPARQDGITTLSVSSFVICDQNQQPVATLCIMRDSTERKRAEGQIQHHRERQAALYDIDLAIISTLDLRVVLDILLEKINDLLVYSHAASVSLINRDTGELEPIAAQNFDEEEWKTEKLKSGRGLSNIVFETKAPMMVRNAQTDPRTRDPQFFRKHGLVSYLGVPLTAKGEVLGVLSLYTKEEHELSNEEIDFLTTLAGRAAIVIHNCQLYEQTKNQAIELEKTNRTKSEFLSIMSHELRTPLATIMGYTRTVQDKMLGSINQEQEWALGKVTKHSHELLTMINSIMEATKIEAGGITVESQAVNLGDFLNDLTLAYEIPFSKELTLTWNYPPDLPTLHTDKGKLRQILQNLINNGIKFTEKGNVTLSASYFPGAKTVEFKVSDTGIGIPRETIPVIFDRFRQLDSSVTRSYGGVGLGLYIVTTFTNMLGGKIEVESEPGKGSTFTVTFPLNLEEVRAQEDLSASPVASKNNKP
ncbi:MAG: GAF domain-containing protein [Deltaproteobacteria bacterium]|nr:GAF domain-containing protein [Deltaproteobacteria bacterium]